MIISQRSSLGSFARLPYELRLTIWEYILEPHRPLRKEQLSILRANQAIHDEITSSFRYDTIEVHITPVFHEGVFIYPRRLRPSQSAVSYKDHKFAEIPFDQLNVVIHLCAPDPADPGRLLLIYRKAKKLATSLNRVACSTPFKHVSICYHRYNGVDWHFDGDPYETLKYPGRRWLDREIVLVPFLKLEKVEKLEVIPANQRMNRAVGCGFINYAHDFIMRNGQVEGNVSIYKDDPRYRTIASMFDDTDRMAADIEFFLDTQLDYLPGYTSGMLRAARWAEWFKDGTEGHSPYCNWFLYILRFHPECARGHDLGLMKLLNRFKIMIMASTSFIMYGPKPHGNWDHRVFYRKFAHGYPPLSQPDLVKKELLIAVWDKYICCDRLLPPFYWFYVAFMSWRFLQWWKKYRLPRV